MPVWEDEPAKSGGVGGAVAAMAASFNTKDVSSMASGAKEMLKSAKSGGFRVSEEAAKPIMDVLEEMKGRVEELANELANIAVTEPALGNHDYGKRAAAHQQSAFALEDGSPVRVLQSLHGVLTDSHEALKAAVRKYSESESAAQEVFKGEV